MKIEKLKTKWVFLFTSIVINIHAQDTLSLNEIEISTFKQDRTYQKSDIKNNVILSGKHYEEVLLTDLNDKINNNVRQVLAKVPGISIWENEASGIQIGIAVRGLNPNRSWELNTRMNGYDIAADPYGYPEAYFNPPLEAVKSIQFIKGSAAIPYGSQFGGVINYILKGDEFTKPIEVESKQSYGQYNLMSSYNAIGGKVGNLSYYMYYNFRKSDTWRENNTFTYNNAFGKISYDLSPKLKTKFEYTFVDYLSQQPGGLSDSLFHINPQQSVRKRNWFNIQWNQLANTIQYDINENHHIQIQTYYVFSQRNSVGYLASINQPDVDNGNGQYANRQVDRDKYNNLATEIRYINISQIFNRKNYFSTGYKFFKGNTQRFQKGTGTEQESYSLFLTKYYSKDFDLSTTVNSFYIENTFFVLPKIKIIPGLRYENIVSSIDGWINFFNNDKISLSRTRQVFLYGGAVEWEYLPKQFFTINYTRNFRPVLYSELIPSSMNEVIDPNLKDNNGGVAEINFQGTILKNALSYQITPFYIHYNDKIGTIIKDGNNFRTNIGNAENKGIELLIDVFILKAFKLHSSYDVNVYYSAIFQNFKYTSWNDPLILGTTNDLKGKSVEYAPDYIHRTGLKFISKFFEIAYQKQIYSDVFTDAKNTEMANASATSGKIKGYMIDDISIQIKLKKYLFISGTINNVFDVKYATRRAGGYPGPGLLPGSGRTWVVSIGIRL